MTSVIESSLRAEIAALHEQILNAHKAENMDEAFHELGKLVGMLPDDIRPEHVKPFTLHPGPFKTKKKEADDLL